ncbi:MAG: DUF4381 domain-containing protein [Legionella sp.]|nr:MAG: DUF4381 domain-containing protein [Legionella sp.]
MDKPDALAQLKDIHLADPIGLWPMAPGWYGLIVFLLLGLILGAYWLHLRKVQAKPKKQALELLKSYKRQYEKDKNTQQTSARVSELLRRVALVYFSREEVASLHGEAWVAFLNRTGKNLDFKPVQGMLLDSPFKTAETIDLQPLITCAEQWIQQRRAPCSN